MDGVVVWVELLCGWSCCVGGVVVWVEVVWVELLCGWSCCVVRVVVWMELLCGWSCCVKKPLWLGADMKVARKLH